MANYVSNTPYRLESTLKKRGKQPHMLRVSLFLLRYRDEHRINKDMCSKKNIEILKKEGFGPPPDEFLSEKGKVEFPFAMTSEEFKDKLVEIYPMLRNERYLLMRADKSNKLQSLNVACSSYNPKEIYNSNLGQGKLYIRFGTEAEVTAANSMAPPAYKKQKLILPKQPMILVSPRSSVETSVSSRQVNVAQVTTSTENHRVLSERTGIVSRSNNYPAVNDDSTAANSIIQLLLADRALRMKVLSGLTVGLGSENADSTNTATILNSTNANGPPMSLGRPIGLQTSVNSTLSSPQLPDNSTTLVRQHDTSDQVQSFIPSESNYERAGDINIPPVLSSIHDIPQQAMTVDPDQQPLPEDLNGIDDLVRKQDWIGVLLRLADENLQNVSPFEKSIEDKIIKNIRDTGRVDVFPELLKMEGFFSWIQANFRYVYSVTLHNVGELKEFVKNLNGGLDQVTWFHSQQNCLSSDGATALVKLLPSLRLLQNLYLYEVDLCEVDVEKVVQALKSCNKLKRLNLDWNKVGARGATALAEILPSLELLQDLSLSDNNLDEVDVEKVVRALKSCKKLKKLFLCANKIGARGATALAEMLPSLELLEVLGLRDNNLDDVDVEKVLQALKSCKNLEILNLDGNKVSARRTKAHVAEILPSVTLL